jgi:dienelactone hydrolase
MKNIKNIIYGFLLVILAGYAASAQTAAFNPSDVIKIEANPAKGFAYPYYLYVPPELRSQAERKKTHTILVLPNNTGKIDDAFEVHEADVKRRSAQAGQIAAMLKTAVLMPVFPRPASDWKIYTHALDRDAMTTGKREFARFDLQLVAMIDDTRALLKKEGLKFDKKVLINGFSASGMFANRFTFLHPTRVKAAAIGSPGGWAIVPATAYKEKTLRYPIGIGDFKNVTGKKIDWKNLRKVPMFIFLGDKDDNDSVVFRDSYEDEDEKLIFEIFGKTPVKRWTMAKTLYEQNRLNAEFKLYPNVAHTVTPQIRDDILAFMRKHAQ